MRKLTSTSLVALMLVPGLLAIFGVIPTPPETAWAFGVASVASAILGVGIWSVRFASGGKTTPRKWPWVTAALIAALLYVGVSSWCFVRPARPEWSDFGPVFVPLWMTGDLAVAGSRFDVVDKFGPSRVQQEVAHMPESFVAKLATLIVMLALFLIATTCLIVAFFLAGRELHGPPPTVDPKEAGRDQEESLHKVGACANPKLNIVFIHGIAGHYRKTWQAGENEADYWPSWVAQEVSDAQIYSLQYNAAPSLWLGPTMPLIPRGKNLLNLFAANGTFRLPSVFIVHSFGGLALKQLWRSAHDQNHDAALKSIRAVIFLATPHHGSLLTYLNFLSIRFAGRTTQTVEDLAHHNQVLLDLDEYYRNHPISSNYVYYETQLTPMGPITAKVVDEASASLALPGVFPIGLLADHLTICKPTSPNHDISGRIRSDLENITSALFGPPSQPDRHEIDRYEITLAVAPLEMQDIQFGEGRTSRTVRCDNVAHIEYLVTFAQTNRFQSPFMLRYIARENGFIQAASRSHDNEASVAEKFQDESGLRANFTFTPKASETYQFAMKVYKGFDQGNRYVAFSLPKQAHYKNVRLTLDLSAYFKAGYAAEPAPKLIRNRNYEICATANPVGEPVPSTEPHPGVYEWGLLDITDGVLNLVWDVIEGKHGSHLMGEGESKSESGISITSEPEIARPIQALPLQEVPPGPMPDWTKISERVITAFAKTNDTPEKAMRLIAKAGQLRRAADPHEPEVQILELVDVVLTPFSPKAFWTDAFLEACKQGPRMVQALLDSQSMQQFDAATKADVMSLKRYMQSLWPDYQEYLRLTGEPSSQA